MPIFSDLSLYYCGSSTSFKPSFYFSQYTNPSPSYVSRSGGFSGFSSGLPASSRLLPTPPRITKYSPLLPTISESPAIAGLPRRPLPRISSPRIPIYKPPKPIDIDTADIDVSTPRKRPDRISRDRDDPQQGTIKRGRTVVRLHTRRLRDNPLLQPRRKTPGEKLVEKFLIRDKNEEEAKRRRLEEEALRLKNVYKEPSPVPVEEKPIENGEENNNRRRKSIQDCLLELESVIGLDETEREYLVQQNIISAESKDDSKDNTESESEALDRILSQTEKETEGKKLKTPLNVEPESAPSIDGNSSQKCSVKSKQRKPSEKTETVKKRPKKRDKNATIKQSKSDIPEIPEQPPMEKSLLQRRNTKKMRRNSRDLEILMLDLSSDNQDRSVTPKSNSTCSTPTASIPSTPLDSVLSTPCDSFPPTPVDSVRPSPMGSVQPVWPTPKSSSVHMQQTQIESLKSSSSSGTSTPSDSVPSTSVCAAQLITATSKITTPISSTSSSPISSASSTPPNSVPGTPNLLLKQNAEPLTDKQKKIVPKAQSSNRDMFPFKTKLNENKPDIKGVNKISADVSVQNAMDMFKKTPLKFIVDEIKVEESPKSPKILHYEVIVEDIPFQRQTSEILEDITEENETDVEEFWNKEDAEAHKLSKLVKNISKFNVKENEKQDCLSTSESTPKTFPENNKTVQNKESKAKQSDSKTFKRKEDTIFKFPDIKQGENKTTGKRGGELKQGPGKFVFPGKRKDAQKQNQIDDKFPKLNETESKQQEMLNGITAIETSKPPLITDLIPKSEKESFGDNLDNKTSGSYGKWGQRTADLSQKQEGNKLKRSIAQQSVQPALTEKATKPETLKQENSSILQTNQKAEKSWKSSTAIESIPKTGSELIVDKNKTLDISTLNNNLKDVEKKFKVKDKPNTSTENISAKLISSITEKQSPKTLSKTESKQELELNKDLKENHLSQTKAIPNRPEKDKKENISEEKYLTSDSGNFTKLISVGETIRTAEENDLSLQTSKTTDPSVIKKPQLSLLKDDEAQIPAWKKALMAKKNDQVNAATESPSLSKISEVSSTPAETSPIIPIQTSISPKEHNSSVNNASNESSNKVPKPKAKENIANLDIKKTTELDKISGKSKQFEIGISESKVKSPGESSKDKIGEKKLEESKTKVIGKPFTAENDKQKDSLPAWKKKLIEMKQDSSAPKSLESSLVEKIKSERTEENKQKVDSPKLDETKPKAKIDTTTSPENKKPTEVKPAETSSRDKMKPEINAEDETKKTLPFVKPKPAETKVTEIKEKTLGKKKPPDLKIINSAFQSPEASPKEKIKSPELSPKEKVKSPEISPKGKVKSPEISPKEKVKSPGIFPNDKTKSPEGALKEKVESTEVSPKGKVQPSQTLAKDKLKSSQPGKGKSSASLTVEQIKSPPGKMDQVTLPETSPKAQVISQEISPKEKVKSPEMSPKGKTNSPTNLQSEKPTSPPSGKTKARETKIGNKSKSPEMSPTEKTKPAGVKELDKAKSTSKSKGKGPATKTSSPKEIPPTDREKAENTKQKQIKSSPPKETKSETSLISESQTEPPAEKPTSSRPPSMGKPPGTPSRKMLTSNRRDFLRKSFVPSEQQGPGQASSPIKTEASSGHPKSTGSKKNAEPQLPVPADDEDSSEEETDSEEETETETDDDGEDVSPGLQRASTSSEDSGFDSLPTSVPGSPACYKWGPNNKDCDVNCHKKCEKLMPHLCGVNQKLIVEALTSLKKGSSVSSSDSGAPSPSLSSTTSLALDPYEDSSPPTTLLKSGRVTPPATTIPRFRKYSVEDFQFLKVLGKGSFGKVLLAELKGTECYYAVKCLKKDVVLEDDDVECTLIERKVLALGTKHPYLCHLFCTFQTESHLFFVMEYLNGGDLMFHIQQSGRFQEPRARFYAAEIISGLKFLHKKGVVYRDLKLDNILLDFDGHVRIADFGMCKVQIYLDRTADTFCGTPDYMAPEIIKGLKYNQSVDWWSFGILLYEMLIGQSPFSGCDEDDLFWSICNEQPHFPRFLTREAHSILSLLLEKDASVRLGTAECLAGDVTNQQFFRNMDWDALERRELDPPFKPRLMHPLDVQYFDKAFTAERAKLTPVDREILQSMDQTQFQGFSYTNPNATD